MQKLKYITHSLSLLGLMSVALICSAASNESARVLVHTLNYISRDYSNSIEKAGVVKSETEYQEMLTFIASAHKYYEENKAQWSAAESEKIASMIATVDSLVMVKAAFEAVSVAANTAKAEVIKASNLTVAPATYPHLMNGKAVFAAQCAKCHGNTGYGDGKEGLKLNPSPRNFHDNSKMEVMSPFTIYNTVRCGVQGTGMKPHPDLTDEEVWDVAFYVLNYRYGTVENDKQATEEIIKTRFASMGLEQVATSSDMELASKYKANKQELAALRSYQVEDSKGQFINTALKYIDESMAATREGNYEEAEKLANLAYLEGIEPIEKQLRATDPALMQQLEDQMANTRKTISSRKGAAEVNDSLKASKVLITAVAETLKGGEMTFLLAIMMSISILLREGLEAFLVIMVILGIIKAAGLTALNRYIHAGWLLAVAVGALLWVAGGRLIQAHMAQVELMEGIIAVVAIVMLLLIGFWLHGKSESGKWRAYVSEKVKDVTAAGSMKGLFALSFFVVFREVFESVLFLQAINIEGGGKQQTAIIIGVLLAFILVLTLAYFVLKYSTKLPIPTLFKISSYIMGVLAVVLAGKAIHSFQETGLVGINGLAHLPRFELMGIFPTAETLLAQIAVLSIVIFTMRYVSRVRVA